MLSKEKLYNTLDKIDNKGYKAYKEIQNNWYNFDEFQIDIPYVQGDPFARPSKVFIRIEQKKAKFPNYLLKEKVRIQATEDYLTRKINNLIQEKVKRKRGSEKSGRINIVKTGQEVLERTAIEFNKEIIEARLNLGLPAKGRKILGHQAQKMFFEELPQLVTEGLQYTNIGSKKIEHHVYIIEDQKILREKLVEKI